MGVNETMLGRPVDVSLARYLAEGGAPNGLGDGRAVRSAYGRWANETFHQAQRDARSVSPAEFRELAEKLAKEAAA